MNIPTTNQKRVVIIGAGFAGLNLAKRLSRKYQVVLLDKNNYHTFQPLLYQVATAGLEPDSIAHSIRTLFKKHPSFFFRIAHINKIDSEKKMIDSNIGELSYDYLVIATGSITNYYGNANVEKYSMSMKTVPEALDLRSLILQNLEEALLVNDLQERERLMNFVIVGGGPTGVELSGAFAELRNHVLPTDYPDLDVRRMKVNLIQADDRLLNGMSAHASEKARKNLEDMGVQIWFDTTVKDYDGKTVVTNKDNFEATTLIWTAGVKGAIISGLTQESVVGNRYSVDAYNEIKGIKDIFAIGDVSVMIDEKHPKGHPMMAQVAIQQGRNLACNLNGKLKNNYKPKAFVYKDKGSMATIGRNKAVADIGRFKLSGWIAWLIWMFIHLISLVGFRNKVVALVNWVIQYFQYNKGVRLIIRPYKKIEEHYPNSHLMEGTGEE